MKTAGSVWSAFVVLSTLLVSFGCEAERRPSPSGQAGTGGGAGTGGAGSGAAGTGAQIACTTLNTGCRCAEGPPQPPEAATCSAVSVEGVNYDERGNCCKGTFFCTCTSYSCVKDTGTGTCACGTSKSVKAVYQGTASTSCPTPTATQKCCYSPDLKTCRCSVLDCLVSETVVATCAVSRLLDCGDERAVLSCK